MTDLRKNTTFMHFWDAINEGRAERGLPEALFANVREMWETAMNPTPVEVDRALADKRSFSAVFHGVAKRADFNILVEVFHPRPGIASQYVDARSMGDGRVMFDIDRGYGRQTYIIATDPARRQTPEAVL